MALSLVCKDCNHTLRSVAEAQEHGELTGHGNFEESTAAVSFVFKLDVSSVRNVAVKPPRHIIATGLPPIVCKGCDSCLRTAQLSVECGTPTLCERRTGTSHHFQAWLCRC